MSTIITKAGSSIDSLLKSSTQPDLGQAEAKIEELQTDLSMDVRGLSALTITYCLIACTLLENFIPSGGRT